MRRSPTLVCLQVAHRNIDCWSCRVDSWDKTKADADWNWSLIPTSMKGICAEVDKVDSSRIAISRYAELQKPLQKRSCSFKESFTCIMAANPTKGRKFFLVQLSFLSLQVRFAMRCSHYPQFYAEKGGDERDEEADCIPADYPSQVTLHLGTQTEFKQTSRKW